MIMMVVIDTSHYWPTIGCITDSVDTGCVSMLYYDILFTSVTD